MRQAHDGTEYAKTLSDMRDSFLDSLIMMDFDPPDALELLAVIVADVAINTEHPEGFVAHLLCRVGQHVTSGERV